jgi:hypothetical protein
MTHRLKSLLILAGGFLAACANLTPNATPDRHAGWVQPLGKGTVTTYARFDARGTPEAIGVAFSPTALDDLPTGSDNHRCHGRTREGMVGHETKCQHTFEFAIPLPDVAARRDDIPFKWVLLNWNPAGHIPPGIYDRPHFDVHFQMASIAEIFAIEPGPCGLEFVRCDQFQIAKKPVPSIYMHADYKDVDAVVPAMGNHLIDVTGPEFSKQPFTRSWIFGVYDGRVIFYEEMVTREHMLSKPNACAPIKLPSAYAVRGYYPSRSCIRHDAASGEYTVSMEGFVLREASAPATAAMK